MMGRAFVAIMLREVRRGWAGGGLAWPMIFYLSVATLFPFAVGPDKALLLKTGGGIIWIAALLASLLPVERLIEADRESGFLDQMALRAIAEEWTALAKLMGHWLGFAPPLLLATIVSAALMGLPVDRLPYLLAGLALASPALAALGLIAASLTAGLRGGSALAGLIIVPLAVPLLIFGAGSLRVGGQSGIWLLAASSLFLTAIAPFVAGAAIRARE